MKHRCMIDSLQKSALILVTHNVFSCFLCAAEASVFTVLPRPTYTKHREKICTLPQHNVLLYKSMLFSKAFFALTIPWYLPCSRDLRKTTRKHKHFCQISMFFHIPINLRCLASFDEWRKCMHFLRYKNITVHADNILFQ